MTKTLDGYLLIDKPRGWTSFDVVNKVRFTAGDYLGQKPKTVKVGHAGTLDPLASGLLIVLMGQYTKRQAKLMKLDKTYQAEVRLGQTSRTDDSEGPLMAASDRRPSVKEVTSCLNGFIGNLWQTPPDFSAVKVSGQPAYKLARAGRQLELKKRQITVYGIDDIDYRYPTIKLTFKVSSGTYIRVLARQIGERLETGAYLKELRRTQIGPYELSEAMDVSQLDHQPLDRLLKQS